VSRQGARSADGTEQVFDTESARLQHLGLHVLECVVSTFRANIRESIFMWSVLFCARFFPGGALILSPPPPKDEKRRCCVLLLERVRNKTPRYIYIYIYIQVVRVPRIIHNILITYLHGQGVGEGGGEVSEQ
jgi:hypothetical protein